MIIDYGLLLLIAYNLETSRLVPKTGAFAGEIIKCTTLRQGRALTPTSTSQKLEDARAPNESMLKSQIAYTCEPDMDNLLPSTS